MQQHQAEKGTSHRFNLPAPAAPVVEQRELLIAGVELWIAAQRVIAGTGNSSTDEHNEDLKQLRLVVLKTAQILESDEALTCYDAYMAASQRTEGEGQL